MLLSRRIGGAETLASSLEACWHNEGIESKIAYLDTETPGKLSRITRIRNVRSAYKDFLPDIVVPHSALPNAYCRLALPSDAIVVPVLHSSADDYSSKSLWFLERLFQTRRNDSIVAVSEIAKDRYVSRFPNHPCIHVISNGVSDPGYVARHAPTVPKIATLARVASMKNPWLWKHVVDHYSRAQAEIQFEWVGPVELQDNTHLLVEQHNSQVSVGRFVGARTNAAEYLEGYDIYFHPADRESFGIAILEAVMAGLPVVASDAVAHTVGTDLIAETFPAGDMDAATRAIENVIHNYALHMESSLARRNTALARYAISKTANHYAALFGSLVERPTGRLA